MPSTNELPVFDDARVHSLRGDKNPVDPWRPHAFFVEPERTATGVVEDVATVFLTNRECPFRCLMCDLWKYTTDERVPEGAIPAQITWALQQLPPTRHVKLYNAGNFFDAQAIPPVDRPAIAQLVAGFQTVVIECHPRLIGASCLEFQASLTGRLQVAIGLETVHPEVLPRLNKRMTLPLFERAVHFLREHGISVRAFILLRPPFLTEAEGVEWAKKSLRYAFDLGVECCSVIPTRAGNGAMEHLQERGLFLPPHLQSLEEVLEFGIHLRAGRVFVDLWDIERFFPCMRCGPNRANRLREMNLSQTVVAPIACGCGTAL
jgi:radical SAM enzyme (TIGR01210 family)